MLKIPGVPIPGEGGPDDSEGNRVETIREWESSRGSFRFHEFNFKFWIIPRNGVKTEGACPLMNFSLGKVYPL